MKKKINRKPAYKKGGESWVSDKMANLPMYQMGAQTTFPSTIGFNQIPPTLQPQQNQLDPNSLNYGQNWATNNPLPQMQSMGMNGQAGFNYNPNLVGNLENKPSDVLQQNQEQYTYNATQNTPQEASQFFNPYSGVDVQSRIAYGANQLGKGNVGQGVLGLASGALGLGRIGVGAYAAGNREKYIMNEYNNNVNKAMTPRPMSLQQDGGMIDFMQDGGYNYNQTGDTNISTTDAQNINRGTGIKFTPEFAQAYFSTQSAPVQASQIQTPIQNKNVIDITSDGKFTDRKIWRNQRPEWYVGKEDAVEGKDYTRVPYSQWENYKMTPEYNQFKNPQQDNRVAEFQDGGQQAQQPQPEQVIQAFAQLTQQDPQQIIQQLQQLSPEEQGQALQQMMAALQQGQQNPQEEQAEGQMSNPQNGVPQEEMEQQFQKGGEFVKKLTGEYTTPLEENDPSITAEVENNEYLQDPQGQVTKAIGDNHESGGIKVALEGGTRIVSDHLKLGSENAKHYKENFDLEVKASDTYAKVLDKFTKKSGLQKIVDEQEKVISQIKKSEEAAQGSSTAQSTTDLNKRFLSQKLSELEQEKAPLEEARKSLLNDVFNKQEESKPAEETETYTGEDMEGQEEYAKGGEVPKYQDGKNQDRFNDWYASLEANGYTGKRELDEARAWQAQNDPNTIIDYYTTSGQPLTAKHIDMAKQQFKDAFVTAGIPINRSSSSLTPEEAKRLQSAIGERLTPNFILEGHNDSKQDWRAPLSGFKGINPIEGAQPQQITAPSLPNMYQAPTEQIQAQVPAAVEQGKAPTGKPLNLMTLPNQAPMLPDSLEGALKVTRRYDRVAPMQLSTEQQIGDLRSQEAQAIAQINQLPEPQRAGALANLAAITQQNIAKINADVNRTNIASENQAQQFNAQTQAQEENARASDLQNYENKIMRAKATTDADVRGYYNQLAAGNLANYNAIQNVNLLNQMYPNYAFTGQGVEQTQGAPLFNAAQATASGIPVNTKKKTTKKRFGGKTK